MNNLKAGAVLLGKVKTGEISVGSPYNLRNEQAQTIKKGRKFTYFKKEFGKRTKLLLPLELALTFDPFTGSTELYNAENEYRVPGGVEQGIWLLKAAAQADPLCKEVLAGKVGLNPEQWKIDEEKITEQDRMILGRYRSAKIFTIPIINTTCKALSSQSFGRNVYCPVKLDSATGDVVGEEPVLYTLSRLELARAFERRKVMEHECKEGAYKALTDKQKEELIKGVFKDAKFSGLRKSNVMKVLAFEIDRANELTIELNDIVSTGFNDFEQLLSLNFEVHGKINSVIRGAEKLQDTYLDFVEIDVICPGPGSGISKEDKNGIAQKTDWNIVVSKKISGFAGYDQFVQKYHEHLDRDLKEEEEEFVRGTGALRKISDDKLLEAYKAEFDVTATDITDEILERFSDIITIISSDDSIAERLAEGEANVNKVELDESQMMQEFKEVDKQKQQQTDIDLTDDEFVVA